MPLRAVVADDEPPVVLAVQEALKELDIEVRGAHDGEETLRLIRIDPPDLVLLDVRMPGLDGFGVAEALRGDPATAAIPVIFFSGQLTSEDKVRGLGLAEDYIAKPIDAEELKARVRKVLGRLQDVTSGRLHPGTLAAALRRVVLSGEAGRLLLSQQGERGEIHYAAGRVVRAMQGPRLGDAAVYDLLGWAEGGFEIAAPEEGWVGGETTAELDALLREGTARLGGIPALRQQLRAAAAPLDVPVELRDVIRRRIPPTAASLLGLLDGTRPLDTVLALSPFDAWQTLTLLVVLLGAGALRPAAGSERRSGLRVRVALPIAYRTDGSWEESGTFNLSAWGVFIRTSTACAAGQELSLRVGLPGREEPLVLPGRVVWVNADAGKWGGTGMGVQFGEVAESDRVSIEGYLAQVVAGQLSAAMSAALTIEPERGRA